MQLLPLKPSLPHTALPTCLPRPSSRRWGSRPPLLCTALSRARRACRRPPCRRRLAAASVCIATAAYARSKLSAADGGCRSTAGAAPAAGPHIAAAVPRLCDHWPLPQGRPLPACPRAGRGGCGAAADGRRQPSGPAGKPGGQPRSQPRTQPRCQPGSEPRCQPGGQPGGRRAAVLPPLLQGQAVLALGGRAALPPSRQVGASSEGDC